MFTSLIASENTADSFQQYSMDEVMIKAKAQIKYEDSEKVLGIMNTGK